MRVNCPDCQAKAVIRKSADLGSIKKIETQCTSMSCSSTHEHILINKNILFYPIYFSKNDNFENNLLLECCLCHQKTTIQSRSELSHSVADIYTKCKFCGCREVKTLSFVQHIQIPIKDVFDLSLSVVKSHAQKKPKILKIIQVELFS